LFFGAESELTVSTTGPVTVDVFLPVRQRFSAVQDSLSSQGHSH
jgi:hypothetical protein